MSAPHRFFVEANAVAGDRATLGGDQAKQIADVLRLAAGDHVVLVRDGEEMEVRLETVGRSSVAGVVVSRRPSSAEPRIRLTLALPLLRGDHSEEVIEAVTQLGVSRIVPFTSERSVVRELSAAKLARWGRIARESAETARRGRVPVIERRVPWAELFAELDPPVVVAWEGEKERSLKEAIPGRTLVASVVIGPEGGLSEEEVEIAGRAGATTVRLGARNLRSETAAIAAVAQVFALAEP